MALISKAAVTAPRKKTLIPAGPPGLPKNARALALQKAMDDMEEGVREIDYFV